MVKCKVIENFTLEDYNKLKNIKRKHIDKYGELYVGDQFECDEEMARYLTGKNSKSKVVIKIIELNIANLQYLKKDI